MKTYLDASAVIHASQDSAIGRGLRTQIESGGDDTFVVSPLVRMESLVRPTRTGNREHLLRRLTILEGCSTLQIDAETFRLATHVRAAHNLSTPDAIHLATAGQHDCDRLITGDRRLLSAAEGFAVDVAGPF
jgi:predicted nucleic acid-binding protein